MRHGDAEPIQVVDSSRELSLFGIKQAAAAGKWLQQRYFAHGIDMSLVSPYVRAQQTLTGVRSVVEVKSQEVSNDVTPDGNAQLTHNYIDYLLTQQIINRTLLVISHMPFVSYLVDELSDSEQLLFFDTSSIAIIEYDPAKCLGNLIEIYHPQ